VCPSRVDRWDQSRGVYAPRVSHRPAIGIVGAGRAGLALALALTRSGWPVRALSSRDEGRRAAAQAMLPAVPLVTSAGDVGGVSDIVILAVPDHAVPGAAADLGARAGTVVAHLSGVHTAEVLRDVVPDGAWVGALHPLVAFADVARGAEALEGAFVVLDGDPPAVAALRDVALAVGARPVVLAGSGAGAGSADGAGAASADASGAATADASGAATAKAAHHAAAVLAAGGFVALLDAIVELARVAGLDEATAVEMYGSLVRQGLANAGALGVTGSLTGPVPRGDAHTVHAHLEAIGEMAPDVLDLYLATVRRQLAIAGRRGLPDPEAAAALRTLVGAPDPG
jgi:predicted short-subunit dehydrogenase-like oxidoreductase (DUF2520 family)